MTGTAVSTRRLVHIYRTEGHDVAALAGVDLSVAAGEFIGLLGPSGSGKSTLLSLMGGLFRPSAGHIRVGELELSAATARELDRLRARTVSLMLQGSQRNLLPYCSPRENVGFAQAAARRVDPSGVRDPDEVLASVGLASRADTDLRSLSPGELQLAALAVALAPSPGVLLADEPTGELDHRARDRVLETLGEINAHWGTTIVLVTHDAEVATSLPRTVTIRDGRIGGEGRSGEEYSVVSADGFLPLPAHALVDLPPGTLVRFHPVDGTYHLLVEDEPEAAAGPGGTP
ncbi:ABC transporter ATP-binding protein [Nocardioides pocheonensis]|uniref:ATP-binding cassette domain-containing protein n=1 Tax=Nocardioides pocheonensis TaxID=661485 RepID=A0A3N0GN38_9ACTN|nr:ATP-binding cassette domain-containing protein [Nocardioides pocheonensis]RNM13885.1 ATP-binding cassette domain-containing protein [Nocardioides pocheonensis]